MQLLVLWLMACGDKSEDTALTEPSTEPTEETGSEDTGAEDTGSEEGEDTAESSDTAE